MYTTAIQGPESLLKYNLAPVYSFVWRTAEAIDVLGRWCYTNNASAPPQAHPCLWFTHTPSPFSPCLILIIQHTLLCSETRSSKTSEVGANPESRQHSLSTNYFSTLSLPLSYSNHWWGGFWEYTASCIRLLNKRVFRYLQCQMHSLMSCLHLPPEKWSLLTFQREVNRRGQMKYSLCFPYVQFHCNCTTCNLLSDIDSCFSFLWPLCKAVYCIWCVYF